jgi:uncharacterized protein YdiU (UPF0061 family)
MQAHKLGLLAFRAEREGEEASEDRLLLNDLFTLLHAHEVDMTLFFRQLAKVGTTDDVPAEARVLPLLPALYAPVPSPDAQDALSAWLERYVARVRLDGESDDTRAARMNAVNPLYVPRNYLAQLAIDAAEAGDFAPVNEWLEVLRTPYTEQPGKEQYAAKRPDWARQRAGCAMLSCSS